MTAKRDIDMTTGSILNHIILFSLPLLIGNIFQQLYNMVDTWVVGNFVSNEAFSAVGTVGPVINMLIGFFSGLANGGGVVISQYYGAKRYDEVKRAVHSAILMTVALSILLTMFGITVVPLVVRMMNTPAEVIPESTRYLSIYFSGLTGLLFYNMGAAILRAVGDSRRPFYFLTVSAVLNIILDLYLVIRVKMGVAGVAWATIISQGISALLTMLVLFRTSSVVRLEFRSMKMDWDILKRIVRVGIPSALQMAIVSFSNIFVQSYINHFGTDVMSGWSAYSKVDGLLWLPMQSVGMAVMTFVGQNLGRGQRERAVEGVRMGLFTGLAITGLCMIPIMILAPQTVAIFNSKPEVVQYGTLFLRMITPFAIMAVFSQIYAAALRGSGNSKAPMIIMIFGYVVSRQIYLYVFSHFISNTIIPIGLGYPFGWVVVATLIIIYYHKVGIKGSII
ncbi:MAG: MATE family efflux transporter [Erysipelotrichaceae bacterium]|nr:MATE family efflux transporter [Erysipelotrichaceae bacterium]